MYKIIGADGKEYGPVNAAQLRQWIAERRANSQTRVQPDSGSEWVPLGSLTEFADAFGSAVPPPPIAMVDAQRQAREVLSQDYRVSIGDCMGRAWELLKRDFWFLIGASVVAGLDRGGRIYPLSRCGGESHHRRAYDRRTQRPVPEKDPRAIREFWRYIPRLRPGIRVLARRVSGLYAAHRDRVCPLHPARDIPGSVLGIHHPARHRQGDGLLGCHGVEPEGRRQALVENVRLLSSCSPCWASPDCWCVSWVFLSHSRSVRLQSCMPTRIFSTPGLNPRW